MERARTFEDEKLRKALENLHIPRIDSDYSYENSRSTAEDVLTRSDTLPTERNLERKRTLWLEESSDAQVEEGDADNENIRNSFIESYDEKMDDRPSKIARIGTAPLFSDVSAPVSCGGYVVAEEVDIDDIRDGDMRQSMTANEELEDGHEGETSTQEMELSDSISDAVCSRRSPHQRASSSVMSRCTSSFSNYCYFGDAAMVEECPAVALNEDIPVRRWNECYQQLFDRHYENGDSATNMAQNRDEFVNIDRHFTDTAKRVGRQIIQEYYSTECEKAIPPLRHSVMEDSVADIGRISRGAGGVRYVSHNIFFKFATDELNLFDRSVEKAMKTASHELKGLCSTIHATIKYVLLRRRYATAVLPLSDNTLVFGSRDGGNTLSSLSCTDETHQRIEETMRWLGAAVNVKRHVVYTNDKCKSASLYTPIDLEGHLCGNRFYLVDFARLLPPEMPSLRRSGIVFYNLLRPELVRRLPFPLCSDAYMAWIKPPPCATNDIHLQHNHDVSKASLFLLKSLLPEVAHQLDTSPLVPTGRLLVTALHFCGVNVRHIGVLRSYCHTAIIRRLLLVEMVARTLKNIIREKMRTLGYIDNAKYDSCIHSEFVKIFCINGRKRAACERYWRDTVLKGLTERFHNAFDNGEDIVSIFLNDVMASVEEDEDVPAEHHMPFLLWRRLVEMLGVAGELATTDLSAFHEQWQRGVNPSELRHICTSKRSFLTSFQEAFATASQLFKEVFQCSETSRIETLNTIADLYLECLEMNTQNDFALNNLGRVLILNERLEGVQHPLYRLSDVETHVDGENGNDAAVRKNCAFRDLQMTAAEQRAWDELKRTADDSELPVCALQ